MISLFRPADATIEHYRKRCEARELNDPRLGLDSLDHPPTGFVSDNYGASLGFGESDYTAAVTAIDTWAMYPQPWTKVYAGPAPLERGSVYVARIHGYGVHTLLPGRVLERIEERDASVHRYGFTFATVRGHLEQGVERFEVRWDRNSDKVRFQARAISRPGPLLRAVSPLARRLQLRFHRESPASVLESVRAYRSTPASNN